MYFTFRWLLVHFKREFSFDAVQRLWEVLWTDAPCRNFHLLICVAILDAQTQLFVDKGFGLSEILKVWAYLSSKLTLPYYSMSMS